MATNSMEAADGGKMVTHHYLGDRSSFTPPCQPHNAHILRLPPELLLRISSYLLPAPESVKDTYPKAWCHYGPNPGGYTLISRSRNHSKLSLVCKVWRELAGPQIFEWLVLIAGEECWKDYADKWLRKLEDFPNRSWIRSLWLADPFSRALPGPSPSECPLAKIISLLAGSLEVLRLVDGLVVRSGFQPEFLPVAPRLLKLRTLILDAGDRVIEGEFVFPALVSLPALETLEVIAMQLKPAENSVFEGRSGPPLRELMVALNGDPVTQTRQEAIEQLTTAFSSSLRMTKLQGSGISNLGPALKQVQSTLEALEVYDQDTRLDFEWEWDKTYFELQMPQLRSLSLGLGSSFPPGPLPALLTSANHLDLHFDCPPHESTIQVFESLPNLRWVQVSLRPTLFDSDYRSWIGDRYGEVNRDDWEERLALMCELCDRIGVGSEQMVLVRMSNNTTFHCACLRLLGRQVLENELFTSHLCRKHIDASW